MNRNVETNLWGCMYRSMGYRRPEFGAANNNKFKYWNMARFADRKEMMQHVQHYMDETTQRRARVSTSGLFWGN